jgi:hypothetical protein
VVDDLGLDFDPDDLLTELEDIISTVPTPAASNSRCNDN